MATVFRELSALTRAVAGSQRLDRALSGADVPAAVKRGLLDDITRRRFSAETLDAATDAIEQSGSTAADALAAVATARAFADDDLAQVEASLYAIGKLIEINAELGQALSDFAVDDSQKAELLTELLAGKANPSAVELVATYVYLDHGRRLGRRVSEAARLAAIRRGTLIAEVRTAIEIDESHRVAIENALHTALGRPVQPRFSVDESIVGSVVVRVGDEVFDGSVATRLEQARQAVTA